MTLDAITILANTPQSLVALDAIDSTNRLLQLLKCFCPLLFGQSTFFIANDGEGHIFATFVHQALNNGLGAPISLAISEQAISSLQ